MSRAHQKQVVKSVKKIYDEVHGYIDITEVELKIIDTPTFQRLRFIKQLALAWYVYPGATHTRFSHSLGTLHLMGLIAAQLFNEGYIHYKEDVQLLRLAALLHDIGHTPFSHAIEPIYRDKLGITHEDITAYIIQKDAYIPELLENYGFRPWEIVDILHGRHREKLYNQLISSDLDVDRLDYLLRDSLHTGVRYGTIDIHRIIETITVDGEGRLAFLDKGLDAVESFYISRVNMYKAVYYHKTIVSFELMLRKIYERLASEQVPEIIDFVSEQGIRKVIEEGRVYTWNDHWLIGLMTRYASSKEISEKSRRLIMDFFSRIGYKVREDRSRYANTELDREKDPDIIKLQEIANRIRSCQGIDEEDVVVFIDDIKILENDLDKVPRVIVKGGLSIPIKEFKESIVSRLPLRYHVKRLYVSRNVRV